jgi:arsenate reductase-like glutaredoxin family protein
MKSTDKTPLADIEFRARHLATARAIASSRVQNLQAEIDRLRKRHLLGIIAAAATVKECENALRQEIEQHPELFERPRTVVFHGIKVGYQKGKGKLVYGDEAKVCELIRKKLGDKAGSLIKVTETPIAAALLNLDAGTLQKLGCTIEDTGDQIVIKAVDGEMEKLLKRFLDEAADKTGGEEEAA